MKKLLSLCIILVCLSGCTQGRTPVAKLPEMRKPSNRVPGLTQYLYAPEIGENYSFNACARYVMKTFGDHDYDYAFFAGLTGNELVQFYAYDNAYLGSNITEYKLSDMDYAYAEYVFRACGYEAMFVPEPDLRANRDTYMEMLINSIDNGIPVIRRSYDWRDWHVVMGYEDYGDRLVCMVHNTGKPEIIWADELFPETEDENDVARYWRGWLFVEGKYEDKALKQIYRDIVFGLPKLLATKTNDYCFGAEALRAWAGDIEKGKYDSYTEEQFEDWGIKWPAYGVYVNGLSASSISCYGFWDKAQALNEDFGFIEDIKKQYMILHFLYNGGEENFQGIPFYEEYMAEHPELRRNNLETLGGGYGVKISVLNNADRRRKIVETLRKCADCMDEVVRIINESVGG